MARQLARDATELSVRLTDTAIAVSRDESCINVAVQRDAKRTRLSIYYLDTDSYPHGPCVASTEDAAIEPQLQIVNAEHEYNSRLEDVLATVCEALGVECSVLKPGDTVAAAEPDGADAAEDMDDDGDDAEQEDDDESEEEYMADDDDVNLTTTILQKLTRWTNLEEALTCPKAALDDEEGDAKPAEAAMTTEERLAAKRQLFNPKEAFQMLSKELMDIMRGTVPWLSADAIAGDIYKWDVWISETDSSLPLAQDLLELERRTGDGRVHLQLTFKRGLHPFFPTAVQVVSPRFQGPLAGALASHPMLQLQNWDPWRHIKELVLHLRTFLELVGRVDLPATLASISRGEQAAYSEVEACLSRMEALTGDRPVCAAAWQEMYSTRDAGVDRARMDALKPSNKRAKTESTKEQAWAAGTGYGTGHRGGSSEVWDSRASAAAQAAHDAELQTLASRLAELLPAGFSGSSGSADQPICLDGDGAGGAADAGGGWADDNLAVVGNSCLLPVLLRELANATFSDMANRGAFYEALLQVALQLAFHPPAACLFVQPHSLSASSPPRNARSILAELRQQADSFLRVFRPSEDGGALTAGPSTSVPAAAHLQQAAEAARQEEDTSLRLARLIVDVAGRISTLVDGLQAESALSPAAPTPSPAAGGGGRRTRGGAAAGASSAASQPSADDAARAYQQAMNGHQMETVEGLAANHLFAKHTDKENVAPRARMLRVGKELASLTATLPLNYSSSVFVRVDENNLALWRALITGPDDTPYSGGAFIFDIYFPPTYPSVPPQVLLKTTGGGRVRFNPNLYNCGKVCLSLLGTWGGDRGESWDSNVSSMLQVLVSIQSLILVDQPFFNEPGYESTMHSETGRKQSRDYSANIAEQTMRYAIEEQLKTPPAEFEEALRDHFRLRKDTVVATWEKWVTDTATHDPARSKRMRGHLTNIRQMLAAL